MPMDRCSGATDAVGEDTCTSSIRIRPAVRSSNPAMHRSVVVLPQPLGPSRTTSLPEAIVRSMPSTAAATPNFLTSPSITSCVM